MIEVQHLTKSFDGFRALDDVCLTVPKGRVYGLVGPNGAGKSTLIRHLAGILRQDSGQVLLGGQAIYESPSLKQQICYIPDDLYHFVSADVRAMKAFYASMYPKFDHNRFAQLKEIFPIDERQRVRRLSRGMQKQVSFWIGMCCRPNVLILDEPVDGLDPVMRRQIWKLILNDVAEREMTVLISSHNLRELEDVCDHVGIINRGKVLLERSLSELQDNIVKIQIVFADGHEPDLSPLHVLHQSATGKIRTLIIRGNSDDIANHLAAQQPIFSEMLPLSLEEIFIYELGGADYVVQDIIL